MLELGQKKATNNSVVPESCASHRFLSWPRWEFASRRSSWL